MRRRHEYCSLTIHFILVLFTFITIDTTVITFIHGTCITITTYGTQCCNCSVFCFQVRFSLTMFYLAIFGLFYCLDMRS